jgi:hypothetical protein
MQAIDNALVSPSSSPRQIFHDADVLNIDLDEARNDLSLLENVALVDNTGGFGDSNHVAIVTPSATPRKVFNEDGSLNLVSDDTINDCDLFLGSPPAWPVDSQTVVFDDDINDINSISTLDEFDFSFI